MEQTTFSVRYGYLRWLRHLMDGEPPTFEAIGAAADRTGVTASAWRKAETFPDVRNLEHALSRYFGADPEWITEGKGDPPQPELWKIWVKMRRVRHAAPTGQDALKATEKASRKRG